MFGNSRKKKTLTKPEEYHLDDFQERMTRQNLRFESIDWPTPLKTEQLVNCKVLPSRENFLELLDVGGDYLEVGVLAGDYTAKIIEQLKPNSVTLVDTFSSDDWFNKSEKRFLAESHFRFVENRFSAVENLSLKKGLSQDILPKLDQQFDYIYLDADHSFEAVWLDLNYASKLVRKNGIIGMNDYIMWDYISDEPYGVVQATNRFLNENENFEVICIALSTTLFSDVYMKKLSN